MKQNSKNLIGLEGFIIAHTTASIANVLEMGFYHGNRDFQGKEKKRNWK
jgi:hypothetical protein